MEKDRLISESSESARPDLPTAPNESPRSASQPELPQRLLATAVTDAQAILRDAPLPGPADKSNLAEQKPVVLGDFRLVQRLGEGAMGSVTAPSRSARRGPWP